MATRVNDVGHQVVGAGVSNPLATDFELETERQVIAANTQRGQVYAKQF